MSVIATAVRHLMAAGVTGEALLDAIAEMEAEVRSEPKQRSAGAIRQERYRERKRNEASQVTDGDGCDANPSLSRPLSPQTPQTPTHTHPENNTRARKGHRLPVDWEPKPLTAETAAMVAEWPDGEVQRELAKFRDWAAAATGANSRKSDWDAAWRNWLRRRNEEKPRNYRNDNPKPSGRNAAELARRNLGCH